MDLQPSSGLTIHASHIEQPLYEFFVEWEALRKPTAEADLHWENGVRWARVLAETEEGAIRIAQYHHYMGRRYTIIPDPAST
jgi:hypothetical protein